MAPLPAPDRPEHHYRYDPAKSEAYTATTLAWLGDPAAAGYARNVLARLESATDGPPRPRRAASARLDLSLALIAADQHDEAAGTVLTAETDDLDASLLLLPIMGFLPPDDKRVQATVLAIADELTQDGLVLRYRVEGTDTGFEGSAAGAPALKEGKLGQLCPACHQVMPLTGICENCG